MPYRARMPRDTLTREQIVAAAIELLDAEGLEGLNMRALGKRLGSAATAVYWHVGSKANLIALAGDQVWGEIALPDADDGRLAGGRHADGHRPARDAHPPPLAGAGLRLLRVLRPRQGPPRRPQPRHLSRRPDSPARQADQAAAAVFTFVLGNALGPAAAQLAHQELGRDGGDAEA